MDMIPSDKNLGIGGMNRNGAQVSSTEENLKNTEKTESGNTLPQGDKVEIKSVLPKKDETSVKGFAQKDVETKYAQMLTAVQNLILNNSGSALDAQAGSGSPFLKALQA